MEFRFELPQGPQKHDWKAFYHVYYRVNPGAGVKVLLLRAAAGILGVFLLLLVIGILVSEDSSPGRAVVPGVLCLIQLCYAIGVHPLTVWAGRRNQVSPNAPMTVTIDETGVTDQTGAITTHYEYQAFYAICYYRDIYMLFISPKAALILPERCREGGSSPELRRFLEEKTGKSIRFIK